MGKKIRFGVFVRTCAVVDQFCDAPANLDPGVPAKFECFRCGEKVCGSCSIRMKYLIYGVCRLCHDCVIGETRTETLVMTHLSKLAGVA